MTELLTAAQMRAIEQAAIDSGEVTGLELMERAGQGVVDAVLEEWPHLAKTAQRAVVLCGPGNNGGDGFVVARLLHERGWDVEVFLYGDPEKLPPDAKVNYERWGALGLTSPLTHNSIEASGQVPSLFVDALFGTGLTRPLTGHAVSNAGFLRSLPRDTPVCSIDAPSGLCLDSGSPLHSEQGDVDWISADLSVTFHAAKTGHYLTMGPTFSRTLRVIDIGLTGSARGGGRARSDIPTGETVKLVDRKGIDVAKGGHHKYTHGHALILSGGPGKGGAARLAARGALRIGAGLVTHACPQNAFWESAAQLNAIMVQTLDGVAGLRELLEDARLNALCLGPGMGLAADTEQLVLEALKANRATVLDADALTRFQRAPDKLFDALHRKCVLTPHGGEFAKLFPDIAEKLAAPATTGPAYSKVDATREAAARAGCTVLFKGPDTVIADPDGRCSINASHYDRSAPWLATAGSGDVLAGFITGLLARGFAPMAAAETAAWLHTECALSFGPGLIAEDLPEVLPKVFRTLGL